MVDSLTDMVHHERNLTHVYDNGNNANSTQTSRFFSNNLPETTLQSRHQSYKHSSTSPVRYRSTMVNHGNGETLSDGDRGAKSSNKTQHESESYDDYQYLRPLRSSLRKVNPDESALNRHRTSQKGVRTADIKNERHVDRNYEFDDGQHRHPAHRSSRHGQQVFTHGNQLESSYSIMLHMPTLARKPIRFIFMRHSERANQALGPDWFSRAFQTNVYKAYDPNLPHVLPKRYSKEAYQYDVPLTVNGLRNARLNGRAMATNKLLIDMCFSSSALRCVQTCERILTGMERRDRIPIRIEPGLFECPHSNNKLVDNFMTKRELMDNGYNIKYDYKPFISKLKVPETLDEYFDRCANIMRGILGKYGPYGGTILIVTHAPGLLALTDAMKGFRPREETFYRIISMYPPLAMHMAEYDGSKWRYSEQPFHLLSAT